MLARDRFAKRVWPILLVTATVFMAYPFVDNTNPNKSLLSHELVAMALPILLLAAGYGLFVSPTLRLRAVISSLLATGVAFGLVKLQVSGGTTLGAMVVINSLLGAFCFWRTPEWVPANEEED